ncbi:MAG TPA: radical SAM family heme chaperone HemW [Nevskiaceae bacterium]|nr:radical SAM family heme chaperone HemW [Nevskiaceae bacterium]
MAPAVLPLAVYLHFPWCVRKCPYCDFNSHALRGEVPEADYVAALLRDLDHELAQRPEPREVVSVFLGGGTPSLFSGAAIGAVLEGLSQRLRLVSEVEITLEANPGTTDEGHFRDYRAAGVNRLSLGVQSLDGEQLRKLGRIHDAAAVGRAVRAARAAGFERLNLDLMFALPGQTLAAAEADLAAALAFEPEHLSYYQLTLEPNTEFAARPPLLPDDDSAWAIQEAGQARLAAAGYAQYEVSAYARPGQRCRHNQVYWTFGDYLGLGAGAHGKRSFWREGEWVIERRARHKHPRGYLGAAGSEAAVQESREIPAAERPFEYLMNALRLHEGFDLAHYEAATGLPRASLAPGLAAAGQQGLVEIVGEQVRASLRGRQYLNALLRLFL